LIKTLLSLTPRFLLTPMLLFVAILSHSAGDTGYVLVIPLGAIIFATAGRHPLLGIVAAFAGVSGGFSASILPSSLDPLLQGFTQSAAQIIAPTRIVNPLCNYYFTSASALMVILVGWWITDCVVEPRLAGVELDGDDANQPGLEPLTSAEILGLSGALAALLIACGLLVAGAWAETSPLRNAKHHLFDHDSPLMQAIVPLIFLLFLIPGIVYGYLSGTVKSHRDIVAGMIKSMGSMNYYLVLAFFAAQFTAAFRDSNVGVLLAVKGADGLQTLQLPPQVTIVGIIIISAVLDLVVGSASAKWALLGPIFVPMLMRVGISPELTQAAYRVGDSCMNIITPLMPYFPLVVVYCQRYVKKTGIGTLISLMLPYSLTFMIAWIGLLLTFWTCGWPLGIEGGYTYPGAIELESAVKLPLKP
ncbi:MAG: AbgT family transporter, partial [Planctomycetota bacterium]